MTAVIDSKMQMLNEDEIIGIAAQETNSQYSPEQVKAALLTEVHKSDALVIREGNTFFIINPSKDKTIVMFRALNADTIQNYIDNSIKVARALVKKGVHYLVIDFTDDTVLRILKAIAQGVGNSGFGGKDSGYEVRQGSNGYRAVVRIQGLADVPEPGLSSIEGAQ